MGRKRRIRRRRRTRRRRMEERVWKEYGREGINEHKLEIFTLYKYIQIYMC